MVAMDATTLLLLLFPSAPPPLDPATKLPVEKCKERVELLLENLSKAGIKVVIPTPVLSEVLVKAGVDKAKVVNELSRSSAFQILPFDEMAAVEVAMLTDSDLQSNKPLNDTQTKAKVKFDRQIIAIAKVAGVKTIYTDDGGVKTRAKACGIVAVGTSELPLPQIHPQGELPIPAPKDQIDGAANAQADTSGSTDHGGGSATANAANATNPAQAEGGEATG